jgi:cell division protein FtsB
VSRTLAARRRPRIRLPKLGVTPQVVILLLVLALVSAMAIQPTRQLLEQRRRIEGMAVELGEMNELNQSLEDRIARLQDPDYIEQLAREQSGLVRPGEKPYVVLPPSRKAQRRAEDRAEPKTDIPVQRSDDPGLVEGFLDFIGIH